MCTNYTSKYGSYFIALYNIHYFYLEYLQQILDSTFQFFSDIYLYQTCSIWKSACVIIAKYLVYSAIHCSENANLCNTTICMCLHFCDGQSHQEIKIGAYSVGSNFRIIMRSAPQNQSELAQGFQMGHYYRVLNISRIVFQTGVTMVTGLPYSLQDEGACRLKKGLTIYCVVQWGWCDYQVEI